MTIEGKEAAFARIAAVRKSMVEESGQTGSFAPLIGVNSVLESVVRALEAGATVEDLSRLAEPDVNRALIMEAGRVYDQNIADSIRWANETSGSRRS